MTATLFGARPNSRAAVPCARIAAAAIALACAARAGTLTFDVIPSGGAIYGPPGASIGWGYTLANTSQDNEWLMTTGLSSDAFLYGTPNPFFDLPVLEPGTTLDVPFSDTNLTGLYQLIWDSDAPVGFSNIGSFQLSAEWWSGDPSNGGVFLNDAAVQAVTYSAEVVMSPVVVSPEPCGWRLIAAGLVALLSLRKMTKLFRIPNQDSRGGQG